MATSSDTVTSTVTVTAIQSSGTAEVSFDISKVDINSLPDEYQKIIKGYQGDYTKKTQAISERSKEMQDKIATAEKWTGWYEQNKGLISEFNDWRGKVDLAGDDDDPDSNDNDEPLTASALKKLEKKIDERNTQSDNAFSQGFQMLVKLQGLQMRSGTDITPDPEKIIKYAKENSITDIEAAYEGAYKDEILTARIAKAVAVEKEKWESNNKADVLNANMPKGREVRKVLARDRKK